MILAAATSAASPPPAQALVSEYCVQCHNHKKAKGKINFEGLLERQDAVNDFKDWELAIELLQEGEMPPEDEPQPTSEERQAIVTHLQAWLTASRDALANDPGPVTLRRLTSAEYDYTIQDLTGLSLDLDRLIRSDGVGGEGFSNVGDAQFVQDATVERYLEAAKKVASHALIGAGPLEFVTNPGKTGQELASIERIKALYRQHGFRTGAGEGADAFGLDMYPRAFAAAWQFRHRERLGQPQVKLDDLANERDLSPIFLNHIWDLLQKDAPTFPTADIIDRWRELPTPTHAHDPVVNEIQAACRNLYQRTLAWQKALAATTRDDEEAAVLSGQFFEPEPTHGFRVRLNWPEGAEIARFEISTTPASSSEAAARVLWVEPTIRLRSGRSRRGSFRPLRRYVTAASADQISFGKNPRGDAIHDDSFVMTGAQQWNIEFRVPSGATSAELRVEARLDSDPNRDGLVRCTITDGLIPGETIASTGGASALLGDPLSPQLPEWQQGIADFAQLLPQVSHREPAPSDRDPIPAPYDNTYNNPERNQFHYVIKYHRDDQFLTHHILSPETRKELDQAWTNLLTAFDYHQQYFQFVTQKLDGIDSPPEIDSVTDTWMEGISEKARPFLTQLTGDYQARQEQLAQASNRHLDDALQFADRAWRRPLTADEQTTLRAFYHHQRSEFEADHDQAIRTLLARILMAPAFLYRLENPAPSPEIQRLTAYELANRLSFFLWSSPPDTQLRNAAASGDLLDPKILATQARRLLKDQRAERFATEFFGQWFGFYRFDEFRGIDASRYPQFTTQLKAALYEESIRFFEHIVRHDRPLADILHADYAFLDPELGAHYGIDLPENSPTTPERISGTQAQHRGGLLQLGTILASTSAPLRTSAVKRGDWVLRRILGTPVPPPPADAGSIPADDVQADGLTVRARLEAHRQNPKCTNCHSKIDPLGFALEHFDPVGRWRESYRDGQAIDDSGTLSNGQVIDGMAGLYTYLRDNADLFHRNLVRKLVGYALGRGERLSDQLLIDRLAKSVNEKTSISDLVVELIQSPQFQFRRGRPAATQKPNIETEVKLGKL